MNAFITTVIKNFPLLTLLLWGTPSLAAMRVIYTGTDTERGVCESVRRGMETVIAEALQEEGLRVYDLDEVRRRGHAQVDRSDITGEKKLSFWCRKTGAERGIFAHLIKDSGIYELTVYVVHPQKERVEFAASVDFSDAEAADEAAEKAAKRAAKYIADTVRPLPGPVWEGFCLRTPVPGLAQKYYGHELRGNVIQTLFGVGLAASAFSGGYYQYAKMQYKNYHGGPSYPGDVSYKEEMNEKYRRMDDSFRIFQLCCVSTGVLWLYNFIDAFAFSSSPVDLSHEDRPWRSASLFNDSALTVSPVFLRQDRQTAAGIGLTLNF